GRRGARGDLLRPLTTQAYDRKALGCRASVSFPRQPSFGLLWRRPTRLRRMSSRESIGPASRQPNVPLLSCGRIDKRQVVQGKDERARGTPPRARGRTVQVTIRRGRQTQQLVGQQPSRIGEQARQDVFSAPENDPLKRRVVWCHRF